LAGLAVHAYRRFKARRKRLLAVCAAVVLFCGLSGTRVSLDEDIRALVPSGSPVLDKMLDYAGNAPYLRTLLIALGGEGRDAGAETLVRALKSPEIPEAVFGPGFSPGAAAGLCSLAPSLLGAGRVEDVASLDARGVRKALREDKKLLLGPSGPALRELIAVDPLGLCRKLFADLDLSQAVKPGALTVREGRFTDKSGKYALIVARPAATMTDTAASARVMARLRAAFALLPAGLEHCLSGSYAHSEDNARRIKADLGIVLPLSLALVAGLFLLFLRDRKAWVLFLVPFSSVAVAGFVLYSVSGAASGIVFGFGSVLLGITADYAIHTFYALRGAEDFEDGLEKIGRPLSAGVLTTSAAFAALFFSSIPAIRQVALFGLSGVAAAYAAALFALPHMLYSKSHSNEFECKTPKFLKNRRNLIFQKFAGGRFASAMPIRFLLNANWHYARKDTPEGAKPEPVPPARAGAAKVRAPAPFATFALSFLLVLAIVLCFRSLRFDGDLRNISYTSPERAAEERKMRSILGREDGEPGGAFIVAAGTGSRDESGAGNGLEAALRINEAVWETLKKRGVRVATIAPLLPSGAKQEESRKAWRSFREKRARDVSLFLDEAARAEGFAPDAFAPFKKLIEAESAPVDPQSLKSLGLGFVLDLFLYRDARRSLIYTPLPAGFVPEPDLVAELEKSGATLVSPALFRADIAAAVGDDIFRFCLITLGAILPVVFFLYRSPVRALAVLLPVFSGLAFTLLVFRATGTAVNIFHAAALPLVTALSVDYGIFMQAVLEGELDAAGARGVLLSALTTLAGFGVLLTAGHPALFSLGLAVCGGIVAALLAAFGLQPLLMRER
jgi:predicted exporter